MFSIRARAQSDQSGVRGIVKGRNPLSQGMTGFPEELDWKCWSWLASRREWRLSIGLELWQVPFETVRRRVWEQKEKDWKTNTAWRKSSLLMGEEEDKSRKKDKLDKMALTLMGKSRCKIHFKQERRVLLDACHCPLAEPSTRTWLKHGFLALWSLGASLTVPSFLCCLFC